MLTIPNTEDTQYDEDNMLSDVLAKDSKERSKGIILKSQDSLTGTRLPEALHGCISSGLKVVMQ